MKKLIVISAIFILAGCSAKKAALEFESQPAWIKEKPSTPGYYVGVGSAKKVGLPSQYINNAKKDALADLAGEVSVQVKATSVFHTIETNYGLTESYSQRIETTTSSYLEGFEPVDAYENEDTYWVYYRIRQDTYHEVREKKKKESLDVALSKYIAGTAELSVHRAKEALTFYLQGLQALQDYMKEDNLVTHDGRNFDIGNELFISLNNIVLSLSIKPEINTVQIKRGEEISNGLYFRVNLNDKPIQGIPVELKYSGGYLKQNKKTTGEGGLVVADPGPIFSKNPKETVEASIDLKEIALHAVDDLFIRGLLARRTIDPALTTISILSPVIKLHIDDSICQETDCKNILMKFSEIAIREGFSTDGNKNPDFIFNLIQPQVLPGTSAGGLTSVYVQADFIVTDQLGNQIWIKKTDPIKGVGTAVAEARQKAFAGMVLNIERIYLKQAMDQLN
jgi:hypothetical protein